MGIVAGRAVRLRHGIIHMLLQKNWSVCRVAAHTEGCQVIFQKILSFGRSMRFVAAHTSLLHRTMLELRFGNDITNIFVAIETEFIPSFQKNEFVFGGMGVVALYAIAPHDYLMDAFWILGHNPFMTLITDFVRVCIQQLSMRRVMGIMTFCAFPFFYGSVNKLVFELFLEIIVTLKTQFPTRARFQLEFVLRIAYRKNQKGYDHAG
jgi:hypothetical protein